MDRLLSMVNSGASADHPSHPLVAPLYGALPHPLLYLNTANNQPQRSNSQLPLLSSLALRSHPDPVPLFQPRPTFRPVQIRAPGVIVDHSRTDETPHHLLGPVDIVPRSNTGALQPHFGASAYQTPYSNNIIINQPHRSHGLRNTLGGSANPLPRRVVELRSPARSGQLSPVDTLNTNEPQSADKPNFLLASPINIVPRSEPRQLRFRPEANGAPRKEIIVAKKRLNPLAQAFVPPWLVSPPLFSSTNPYSDSPRFTPTSTPGLTPDNSPLLDNAPRRVLDYTSFHELTSEHIESIKAELLRNPPILVPSEHPKRPSPGLFLHGTPPPGFTRHTACNPYHPSGIRNLPLPPMRFVEDASEDHVRFHSAGMVEAGGLKDTKCIQDDGETFWKINHDNVWSEFVAREVDPFCFGKATC